MVVFLTARIADVMGRHIRAFPAAEADASSLLVGLEYRLVQPVSVLPSELALALGAQAMRSRWATW